MYAARDAQGLVENPDLFPEQEHRRLAANFHRQEAYRPGKQAVYASCRGKIS